VELTLTLVFAAVTAVATAAYAVVAWLAYRDQRQRRAARSGSAPTLDLADKLNDMSDQEPELATKTGVRGKPEGSAWYGAIGGILSATLYWAVFLIMAWALYHWLGTWLF